MRKKQRDRERKSIVMNTKSPLKKKKKLLDLRPYLKTPKVRLLLHQKILILRSTSQTHKHTAGAVCSSLGPELNPEATALEVKPTPDKQL